MERSEEQEMAMTPEGAALDPATLSPTEQEAFQFIEGLCTASGMEMHPLVRSAQPPYLHIELMGEDAKSTFGRVGQALDALQFLCNLILSRRVADDLRLALDAVGYRERRAALLRQRAIELAEEVIARNEEAEFEPMPAHERRIIHTALMEVPGITTYSEGNEPERRIVISPAR